MAYKTGNLALVNDRSFRQAVEHIEEEVMAVVSVDAIDDCQLVLYEGSGLQFMSAFFDEVFRQAWRHLRMELQGNDPVAQRKALI